MFVAGKKNVSVFFFLSASFYSLVVFVVFFKGNKITWVSTPTRFGIRSRSGTVPSVVKVNVRTEAGQNSGLEFSGSGSVRQKQC